MTSQISPTLSKEPTIVGFAFDMHHNRYHFFSFIRHFHAERHCFVCLNNIIRRCHGFDFNGCFLLSAGATVS